MHLSPLTAPEQRVLGCLIEKRFTTPEQYPLTLNALRLAANQSTNRWPVCAYDEETVHRAAQRLCQYGIVRLATGHTSRAIKYRHLAEDALGVGREELALLALLLLRGPQTPGELRARGERLASFQTLEQLEATLERLAERGYARRLARRPGQKEERWVQLLGEGADGELAGDGVPAPARGDAAPAAPASPARAGAAPAAPASPARAGAAPAAPASPAAADALERRVAALEDEVAALRATLAALQAQVGSASPTA
jgi:uncharacterized protein YceH (UPF0502 family)